MTIMTMWAVVQLILAHLFIMSVCYARTFFVDKIEFYATWDACLSIFSIRKFRYLLNQ